MSKHFVLSMFYVVLFFLTATPALADHHNPERIMLNNAKQAIDSGKARLVLDMRTQAGLEAESRKIPDSIRVSTKSDLNKAIIGVSKEDLIITYCT